MNDNPVSSWIAGLGMWPLMILLVLNLLFRRLGQGNGKKRMASLFQAISVFALSSLASFITEKNLTDLYLYAGILTLVITLIILRKSVFPYVRTCLECHTGLDIKTIYFVDNNLCIACQNNQKSTEEEKERRIPETSDSNDTSKD